MQCRACRLQRQTIRQRIGSTEITGLDTNVLPNGHAVRLPAFGFLSVIYNHYRPKTHRQTDRQTDRRTDGRTPVSHNAYPTMLGCKICTLYIMLTAADPKTEKIAKQS